MATFTDIELTSDGDIALSTGRASLVQGRRAVAQRILQRFMVFRGEWFLDLSAGVPYRQQILVKNPVLPIVDVLMRQTVTETPSVVGLQRFSFTFDRERREYRFGFTAETLEGEVDATATIDKTLAPHFLLMMR